jgi:uncharacterized membrane protein YbhN (UPF0104 family)/tRNA A-37 threonylcarbamoyl transferase component Bud32
VCDGVEVVDAPTGRMRQSKDLVSLALAGLGVLAVLGLSVYAHGTTAGVTADMRSIALPVVTILNLIVSILMNLATLIMPATVVVISLFRRQVLMALQGAAAAAGGLFAALAADWGVTRLDWDPLTQGLSVVVGGEYRVVIPALVAQAAGILTAMGPRSRRPIMAASWNLLWFALATSVLTGGATLPGVFAAVLIGRMAGLAIRYALGVTTDRATGAALVEGIRGAGLEPQRIVRVRDISEAQNPTDRLSVRAIRDGTYRPPSGAAHTRSHDAVHAAGLAAAVSDSTASALEKAGGNRIYAVFDGSGRRWDAIVLDGDRQVLGFLQMTWRTLRLRGMDRRSVVSLRQAAERAALLRYAANAAGVRTPRLVGIGEAADSMMLLQTHPLGLKSMADMRPAQMSDAALVDVWRQLDRAHQAGLAHRNITATSILFDDGAEEEQQVWLIGWEDGDVASSELARNLDCAQLLAALALKVGPVRAVAAAARVMPAQTLAGLAGLLQPVVFPTATRELARADRDLIDATRQELTELVATPQPTAAPFQLVRFGWRTVLVVAMTLVAVWAIVTKLNFNQMVEAVGSANPGWMVLSFGLSMLTYVGAATTLVCLLPVRIPPWRSVLSQVAGSFTAITMPGGLGPIALSLRFLNRRGVRASLAAATVALTQLALFIVTVTLVAGSVVVTGETSVLTHLPTTAIAVVVLIVALLGCLLLVRPLRSWLWGKVGPVLTQVWPRVVWVLGRPKRLLLALFGTTVQFGGYVLAFWAATVAFGLTDLPLGNLALVFLVGNTAGSAAPTPGGLGGVEIALTAGLRAIGVDTATAASAAVLFRAITYWARVPIGWAAFRYLSKRGDL